jgi:hypothetical protein
VDQFEITDVSDNASVITLADVNVAQDPEGLKAVFQKFIDLGGDHGDRTVRVRCNGVMMTIDPRRTDNSLERMYEHWKRADLALDADRDIGPGFLPVTSFQKWEDAEELQRRENSNMS